MAASIHHRDYQLLLKRLRETRRLAKVTQIDLASRIMNTQTFVSKVERGERRLDVVELIEWLEAMDVAPLPWLETFIAERYTISVSDSRHRRKISSTR